MLAIEISKLTKYYKVPGFLSLKSVRAIEGLDLNISEGEIVGLLGLNGNGKTTTLRCLLGLIKPTSGLVKVFGRDAALDISVRSDLGYLPENVSFAKTLSCEEILSYLARLDVQKFSDANKIRARVSEVMDIVGVASYAKRRLGTFSKGMTQRVGIAQAILSQPKILVLDEPASGLDPVGVFDMRELFLKLNRELKITILFSSHFIGEVEKVASRVAIIANNRLECVLERDRWRGPNAIPLENTFLEIVRGKA